MDRTMYGKVTPGTYQPYRCALKNGSSPAYALLADLQNSISPGSRSAGYGSLRSRGGSGQQDYATVNPVKSTSLRNTPTSPSSYHVESTGGGKMATSLNNNLSELDTLLEDLSSSRYSSEKRGPVQMNGTLVHATPPRQNSSHLIEEYRALNGAAPGQDSHLLKKVMIEETTTTTTKTTRPTASSATRELDDLMASLSEFKVAHPPESTYAKPRTKKEGAAHLDCMLDSLQADMSKQGVNTTQKGCCSACDKPIVGQVITALGKTWHPEHFVCSHCNQELGTRNFFERDGRPYCEPDYHNLFSPRCAYCNGPILDKCVTALEKTWHTEHFFCAQCGKQFGEEGFHEKDGRPYCRDDYFDMFAPKCGGCSRPIMENYVSALSMQWHADCFVCRDCRQPFQGGSFFDHEGLPYCETHYHSKRGSLCAGCHKPITGRCITAMFKKFHPEHFVCAFCLKQLNKGTFKEQNDRPYCHACFDKLFG
ncbi:paxillin-like isoform X2 [Cimex lectularius]|uniref:LIM zinc-binding domain-containing protein n=1 Tax=Cimex lectularius TaxID=79782 RepID=A0A8I6RQJ3_CIMLE|nr:paxillin-like isoform X2 [Cimex lectularius]